MGAGEVDRRYSTGETVADAEQRLQQFTRRIIPLLDDYIPGVEG